MVTMALMIATAFHVSMAASAPMHSAGMVRVADTNFSNTRTNIHKIASAGYFPLVCLRVIQTGGSNVMGFTGYIENDCGVPVQAYWCDNADVVEQTSVKADPLTIQPNSGRAPITQLVACIGCLDVDREISTATVNATEVEAIGTIGLDHLNVAAD